MLTALLNWVVATTRTGGEILATTVKALVGRELSYFPRLQQPGTRARSVPDAEIIRDIEAALPQGPPDEATSAALLRLCRETLDEVKELTEYQDQKATRLLTIVAFLSALAGVLFARLSDAYPLLILLKSGLRPLAFAAVIGAYITFAMFVILAISGALVIFHATRTVFKYPREPDSVISDQRPSSVLFYAGIIGVTPRQWARTFVAPEAEQVAWRHNVGEQYLRSYIVESYLVAAKVADKIRYLQPGQQLLLFAIRMLLLFVLALVCVIALVAPPPKATAAQSAVTSGLVASSGRSTLSRTPAATPVLSPEPAPLRPKQTAGKTSPLSKGKQTNGTAIQGKPTTGR
jgi:predicted lipid-binding transport protein (Tim44 family)